MLTPEWQSGGDWRPSRLSKRQCRVSANPCFDHYLVEFEHTGEATGVFVQQILGSLSVSVNGHPLVEIGSVDPPVESIHYGPEYKEIPSEFLHDGPNQLQMVITNIPGRFHRLSPILLGPDEKLADIAEPLIWLVEDTVPMTLGVFVAGIMLGVLMYFTAQQRLIYGWFALLCLSGFLRNIFFLISDPQLEAFRISAYFFGSNLQLSAVAALVGCLLSDHNQKLYVYLNVGMAAITLSLLVFMSFAPYAGGQLANYFTNFAFLIIGAFTIFKTIRYYLNSLSVVSAWMLSLIIGSFVLTLHDAWTTLTSPPALFPLAHLAPVLLIMAFLIYVVNEYRALQTSIGMAQAIQARELEEQKLNIMRDLHDGLAGRLASILLLTRRQAPDVAHHLEESLAELRTIMWTLEADDSQVLSETVHRLEAKLSILLRAHGIQIAWRNEITSSTELSMDSRRGLYFVLQEAIHNIIRHADAKNVEISFSIKDKNLNVVVQDDGRGIQNLRAAISNGTGLGGLKQRLESLGGDFAVDTPSRGTRLVFAVPTL